LNTLKSYRFAYKVLFDYIRRIAANFLTQFFIHRYIEITSLLVAVIVNDISVDNSHIIIGVVALIQLVPSLIMNEGYAKIVPYLRIIYLNNRIVSYYLLMNTLIPFLIYSVLFAVTVEESKTNNNILLMTLLLFNNTLFANFLHVFSFSLRNVILYIPLIVGIYSFVFLQVDFLVILLLTALAIVLFISKIRNY
jgi:hypothetical protein